VPFVRRRIDDHIASATAYVRRRGASAVFFGRFTTGLRVLVPGLAGIAGVPYGRFLLFNAAGGIAWSATFVLLGYFAGAAWERVARDASRIGLALLVLILVGLVVGRVLRRVREERRSIPDLLAATRPATWFRKRYPRLSAWLARRSDATSPRGFWLTFVVVVGVTCWWIFFALLQDVLAREEAVLTDRRVMRFVVDHRVAWLTAVMHVVTWLGSSAVLVPLAVSVAIVAAIRYGDRWSAVFVVAAYAGAEILFHLVKASVRRPRPPVSVHLVTVSSFSFPSGHAAAAAAVWGAIAVVASRGRSPRARAAIWATASVIVVLVAASRVYLGVHWWTDVVAGVALAGGWLCLLLVARTLFVTRGGVTPGDGGSGSPRTRSQPAPAASG
jgi:undecaprenyl-diphosphatase